MDPRIAYGLLTAYFNSIDRSGWPDLSPRKIISHEGFCLDVYIG